MKRRTTRRKVKVRPISSFSSQLIESNPIPTESYRNKEKRINANKIYFPTFIRVNISKKGKVVKYRDFKPTFAGNKKANKFLNSEVEITE